MSKILSKTYFSLTGDDAFPRDWPVQRHRLVVLYLLYRVLSKQYNCHLQRRVKNFERNVCLIRKALKKKSMRQSTLSLVVPRFIQNRGEKMWNSLLSELGEISIHPTNYTEDRNIELLKLILDRFTPCQRNPLEVLLFLEISDQEKFSFWKDVLAAIRMSTATKLVERVRLLSMSMKKYIKLILLFHLRRLQLSIRHSPPQLDRTKCLLAFQDKGNCLTFCSFCMETLTYVDITKRPSSFGHYMNADNLKQLCHRDNSDRIFPLRCYHPKRDVSLEVSHPDRRPVLVCQGARSCSALVSFGDGRCPWCTEPMDLLAIHAKTCLDPSLNVIEMCPPCGNLVNQYPELKERLDHLARERLKEKEERQETEDAKKTLLSNKRREYMKSLFLKAKDKKDRARLVH